MKPEACCSSRRDRRMQPVKSHSHRPKTQFCTVQFTYQERNHDLGTGFASGFVGQEGLRDRSPQWVEGQSHGMAFWGRIRPIAGHLLQIVGPTAAIYDAIRYDTIR